MRFTLLSVAAAAAATASVAVATSAPASDTINPYGHPYSRRDLLEPMASTKKSHKTKRGSCPKRLHGQKVLAKAAHKEETSRQDDKTDDSEKATEDKAEPASDNSPSSSDSSSWVEPSETPAPTSEWKEEAPAAAPTPEWTEPAKEEKKEKNKPEATSTFAEPKSTEKAENKKEKPAQNGGGGAKWDATCGSSGATEEVTKLTGPNGSMDWFNCGLDGAGWTPPNLKLEDIRSVPLDEALEDDNSPFKPCKPYKEIFDKYGHELGIP